MSRLSRTPRAPRALLRSARAALVAALAVSLLGIAACDAPREGAPVADSTLRRGLGGEVATLDPQRVGDTYSEQVVRDLYEGLTSYAADGSTEAALASAWDVSPDGLVYTFTLRPDARWSTGERVTAHDVVAGLRRAVTPATGAPAADALRIVAGATRVLAGEAPAETLAVEAPDDRTVVVRLEQPAPYLLDVLTSPIAFPVHRPSLRGDGNLDTAPGRLVSNGAYVLDALVPGDRLRLKRNAQYRAAAEVEVEAVEYLTIADVNAELLRYRAGALDLTSTLPANQLEWARTERPTELQLGPTQGMSLIVFDLTEGPLARHPGVREALALVLDREELVTQVLRAGQQPWYSMVAPGLGGYVPARYSWAAEPAPARLARAQALMRAAGYGPESPLRLRVLHHQNENNRNTALTAGALWKERLGVEVVYDEREFRTFLALRRERGAWDVMVTAVGADYQDPATFLATYRSDAPDNDPGYADPRYDALLAQARAAAEPARRHELYRAAEARLLEGYAATPVYVLVARRLVAPRVEGALLTPLNRTYTRHLRLRELRTPPASPVRQAAQ